MLMMIHCFIVSVFQLNSIPFGGWCQTERSTFNLCPVSQAVYHSLSLSFSLFDLKVIAKYLDRHRDGWGKGQPNLHNHLTHGPHFKWLSEAGEAAGERSNARATSSAHKLSQRSKSGPCLPLILNYKSSAIIWVAFCLRSSSPLPSWLAICFHTLRFALGLVLQLQSVWLDKRRAASRLGPARRQERARAATWAQGPCVSLVVSR